ncbi:MAG: hypothetical protein NC344_00475 [Bacteroidales bacterium]|nr:hypothetical protein [Bacteroidales bacterium]MCM1146311.1 hypothetical protein [Bacteroidales bacterium]MCM1205251.1 hypothetical protein [Bacillota bacterium]MCM1509664.1 hypothetical protein [Clostridium sp.]
MNIKYILLVISAFFFLSCQNEIEEEVYTEIELSKNKIYLWHGYSGTIEVTNSNISDLQVSVDNPRIADVDVKGRTLTVRTNDIGHTIVHLKGKPNCFADIDVYSCALAGLWEDAQNIYTKEYYDVKVVADNQELSDAVRQELLEAMYLRFYSTYRFGSDNVSLAVSLRDNSGHPTYTTYEGTYHYDEDAGMLTLEYGHYCEVYDVKLFMPSMAGRLTLRQDLTKVYQDKYPAENIKEVTVTKWIKALYFDMFQ